jgi:hypothetical protein
MSAGADAAANAQDADSGFALSRAVEPFLENPTPQNAAALLAYLTPNPQDVSTATSILRSYASAHPLWAATASQQLNQANTWNVSLQPTYESLSYLPAPGPFAPATGQFVPGTGTYLPATGTYLPATGTYLPATGTYFPATSPFVPVAGSTRLYPWMSASPAPGTLYASSLRTENTLSNLQLTGTLRDAIGPGITVGGFDASLHEARFDRGDWPAVTYYGLLYPAVADQALP